MTTIHLLWPFFLYAFNSCRLRALAFLCSCSPTATIFQLQDPYSVSEWILWLGISVVALWVMFSSHCQPGLETSVFFWRDTHGGDPVFPAMLPRFHFRLFPVPASLCLIIIHTAGIYRYRLSLMWHTCFVVTFDFFLPHLCSFIVICSAIKLIHRVHSIDLFAKARNHFWPTKSRFGFSVLYSYVAWSAHSKITVPMHATFWRAFQWDVQ